MAERNWEKSLRNYTYPGSQQNKKRFGRNIVADIEQSARNQWLNNSVPVTQHTSGSSYDKMHLTCCTCRRYTEEYQLIWFRSRCCTRRYMCYDCYKNKQAFRCNNCHVTLYTGAFECFDASDNKGTYPTCDTCSETTMPEYILPCNKTICKQCAEKETFFKYVTDGKRETRQIFLECTHHGSTKTLHALQRVHRVFYGKNRNIEGLACVSCGTCLNGRSVELDCGHYSCKMSCTLCKICHKSSQCVGDIYIPRINIEAIIRKESPCKKECLTVTHLQTSYRCLNRYHAYSSILRLPCGEDLCIACMEDSAGKGLVTLQTEESGDRKDHCLCFCSSKKRKHIMAMSNFKAIVAEINYLTPHPGTCSQMNCRNKSVVQFRHCKHNFCMICIRIMLESDYRKRKLGPKIHGEREFCICNTFELCSNAVPTDQLRQYVDSNASNATSPSNTQKETKIRNSSSLVVEKVSGRITGESKTSALDPQKKLKTPSSFSSVVASVPKGITVENKTSALDPQKEVKTPSSSSLVVASVPKGITVENKTSALDPEKELNTPSSSSSVVASVPNSITVKNKVGRIQQPYFESYEYGKCSDRNCTEKPFLKVSGCNHVICRKCASEKLEFEVQIQGFLTCGIQRCTGLFPAEKLKECLANVAAKETCNAKMVETANSTPRSSCNKQPHLSPAEGPVELESMVTYTNDFDANQACSDAKDSTQTNNESKSLKEKIHLTKTYLKDKTMDYLCSAQQFVNKIDVVNTLLPKQPQQTSNRGEKRMATGDCLRDQREILGIPNVGLTCYASCVLQVLGQTPGFKKRLDISCQKSDQLSQNHVDKLLNDLLENVNVGSDGDFIIDWFLMEKLMQRVFKIDRSFRRYEENDCHSFLMTLLNALRKEESENETGEVQSDRKFKDGNEYGSKDGKETAATNKKDLCPAVIFESRLVSKFTYTPCRHEEEVDDQLFRSILVPVRHDFLPLKDALNLFFKGEDFPHNILPCRSCEVSNENTVTTRVLQISKAPMVLMLQLARFEEVQMSESYKKLRKTNHQVMFEKELILDQCTDGQKLQYELYGVVLHTGSMLGGHYTSCVRKQETNRWFYCSDSAVREIKEYSIFQEWNLRNAYVLFYNRKA